MKIVHAQPLGRWSRLTAIHPRGLLLSHLLQDLQFAWRSFRRTPGAALLAVATLAIGIGATAAIFSVIHSVLLDPLPYDRSVPIALVWRQKPAVGGVQASPPPAVGGGAVSRPRADAERWRTATTRGGLTIFSAQWFTPDAGAEPEQVAA